MTLDEVMTELKSRGNERTVTTYRRHGANGEMFGVKIADLKKILKKIKGDQELALELWETGNADAMYLAGLLADGSQMTRKQLDGWARSAWWSMLGAYSVPWVASEHDAAFAIGMKWLKMKNADMACSGWNTYAAAISVRSDEDLDQEEIRRLLPRVESEIDNAPDKVRYCMNDFVVAVASYVKPLLREAKAVAKRLGKVEVDMGDTACKVPVATDMIAKIESMGRVGKKRKSAKC